MEIVHLAPEPRPRDKLGPYGEDEGFCRFPLEFGCGVLTVGASKIAQMGERFEHHADAAARRRTGALRQGRLSIPGARYFVTFCSADRIVCLDTPEVIQSAIQVCQTLISHGDLSELTMSVMPDHVHLLFRLGERLTLARAMAKWRALVRRVVPPVAWQANFFEHRLRPDEEGRLYAWYIFMNPYRACLVPCDVPWRGWWTDGVVKYDFLALARPGPCPYPEWLDNWETKCARIVPGETI